MGEFVSVLKSLLVTCLVVLLLQTHWGSNTLEAHATKWLQTGAVPVYLTHVAEGGSKLIRQGIKKAQSMINKTISSRGSSGDRASQIGNFKFERSEAVTGKRSSEEEIE